jgi:hypothetical protein
VTRSTVAAILLTLVFMMFNSCVHTGWQLKDMALDPDSRSNRMSAVEDELPADAPEVSEDPSGWVRAAYVALDVAHFVLPKTGDASLISRKLRRDLERSYAELFDPVGGLLVQGPPVGWERRAGLEALEGEGARWELPDGTASIRLRAEPGPDLSRMRAAKARRLELEARDDVSGLEDKRGNIGEVPTSRLDWVQTGPGGERARQVSYFVGRDRLYSLEIEGTPAWRADAAAEEVVSQFVEGMTFSESAFSGNPHSRYEYLLGWDSPWRHNIFFSIGSSLAFLALVLGLAWWRLSRIDF